MPGAATHGARALAEWADALNEAPGTARANAWSEIHARRGAWDVISMSHFLPLQVRAAAPLSPARRRARMQAATAARSSSSGRRPAVMHGVRTCEQAFLCNSSHTLELQSTRDQELLPEKRYLTYPPLAKAVGSVPLARRVSRLAPDCHVFGHSHFAWDAVLGPTRYVQAPLCYPSERSRRAKSIRTGAAAAAWRRWQEAGGSGRGGGGGAGAGPGARLLERSDSGAGRPEGAGWVDGLPVLLYVAEWGGGGALMDSGGGGTSDAGGGPGGGGGAPAWRSRWSPSLEAAWSEYYLSNPRRPEDLSLAPWVAQRYEKRRARMRSGGGGGGGPATVESTEAEG